MYIYFRGVRSFNVFFWLFVVSVDEPKILILWSRQKIVLLSLSFVYTTYDLRTDYTVQHNSSLLRLYVQYINCTRVCVRVWSMYGCSSYSLPHLRGQPIIVIVVSLLSSSSDYPCKCKRQYIGIAWTSLNGHFFCTFFRFFI